MIDDFNSSWNFGEASPAARFLKVSDDYDRVESAYSRLKTMVSTGASKSPSLESDYSDITSIGKSLSPVSPILNTRMTSIAKAVIATEDVRRNVGIAMIVAGVAIMAAAMKALFSGGSSDTTKAVAKGSEAAKVLTAPADLAGLTQLASNAEMLRLIGELAEIRAKMDAERLPTAPADFNTDQVAQRDKLVKAKGLTPELANTWMSKISTVINAAKKAGIVINESAVKSITDKTTPLEFLIKETTAIKGSVLALNCFNNTEGFAAKNIIPKISSEFDNLTDLLTACSGLVGEIVTAAREGGVETVAVQKLQELTPEKLASWRSGLDTARLYYSPREENFDTTNIIKSMEFISTAEFTKKAEELIDACTRLGKQVEVAHQTLEKMANLSTDITGNKALLKNGSSGISSLTAVISGVTASIRKACAGIAQISTGYLDFEKAVTALTTTQSQMVSNASFTQPESYRPYAAPESVNMAAIDQLDFNDLEDEELEETLGGIDDQLDQMSQDTAALEQFVVEASKHGVSRSMVIDLESVYPGVITRKVTLSRFTSFKSPTNLAISIEEASAMAAGLKVAGIAVIAGVVAKLIHWIYKRYGMATDSVKSITGHIEQAEEKLIKLRKKVGEAKGDFDKLSDPEKSSVLKALADKASEKYSVNISGLKQTDPVYLFDDILTAVLTKGAADSYNVAVHELVSGGDAGNALATLKIAIEQGFTETEKALSSIETIASNSDSSGTGITADKAHIEFKLDAVKSALKLSGANQAELIEQIKAKLDEWKAPYGKDIPEFKSIEKNLKDLPQKVEGLRGKTDDDVKKLTARFDALNGKLARNPEVYKQIEPSMKVIKADQTALSVITVAFGAILTSGSKFASEYNKTATIVSGLAGDFVGMVKKKT